MDGWGTRKVAKLIVPTERTSLRSWTPTQDHIVLTTLDNVRTRVHVASPVKNGWLVEPMKGLPELARISVTPVDGDTSNELWVNVTNYLTPSTLGVIAPEGQLEVLKETPAFFEAEGYTVTQHMAKSQDGTEVPYFQVAPETIPDGGLPTLHPSWARFRAKWRTNLPRRKGLTPTDPLLAGLATIPKIV